MYHRTWLDQLIATLGWSLAVAGGTLVFWTVLLLVVRDTDPAAGWLAILDGPVNGAAAFCLIKETWKRVR
jgi:hypothetical protein